MASASLNHRSEPRARPHGRLAPEAGGLGGGQRLPATATVSYQIDRDEGPFVSYQIEHDQGPNGSTYETRYRPTVPEDRLKKEVYGVEQF